MNRKTLQGKHQNLLFSFPVKTQEHLDYTSAKWWEVSWRFAVCNVETGQWDNMPGPAGPYFWVSPDSSKVIFTTNFKLGLFDLNTAKYVDLSFNLPGRLITHGSWSPDGRRFAFSMLAPGSFADLSHDSWIINIGSNSIKRIGLNGADTIQHWSPDGKFLLVLTRALDSRKRQVNLVSLDCLHRKVIITEATVTQAQFSIEGRIASIRGPRQDASGEIVPSERGSLWLTRLEHEICRHEIVYSDSLVTFQKVGWFSDNMLFFKALKRDESTGNLDLLNPLFGVLNLVTSELKLLTYPEPDQFNRYSNIGLI